MFGVFPYSLLKLFAWMLYSAYGNAKRMIGDFSEKNHGVLLCPGMKSGVVYLIIFLCAFKNRLGLARCVAPLSEGKYENVAT